MRAASAVLAIDDLGNAPVCRGRANAYPRYTGDDQRRPMMTFQTGSKLRSEAAAPPMATINALLDGFLNLRANLRYGYVNLRTY